MGTGYNDSGMLVHCKGMVALNVQGLFCTVLWDDVAERFKQFYPDYVESLERFKKVFDQVRTCVPIPDPQGFVIFIDLIQDEDECWYDVYGRVSGEKERYGFDLCLFTEWAGFMVDENLLQQMSPQAIIAHILWEMTFYGYSEEDFISPKKELEERGLTEFFKRKGRTYVRSLTGGPKN